MPLLCFLLDLRTIPPPLLRDLKQNLLQLANHYAISSARRPREGSDGAPKLRDRIGLCYLHRRKGGLSDEIKIAYCPIGNFNLRDFHHAVNNLPTNNYMSQSDGCGAPQNSSLEVALSELLNTEALYSWGGSELLKKLVFISSSIITNNEITRKTFMEAAEQCVSVEFILLQQADCDFSEKIKLFSDSISDLENCLLRRYVRDSLVLSSLMKRWLQELKDDQLQVVLVFKDTIADLRDQILCNLFYSSAPTVDGFSPCLTCRCHGQPVNCLPSKGPKKWFCPVNDHDIGGVEVVNSAVKVGEETILFLPSFHDGPNLQKMSSSITFNVIERINLASLDEGVIFGRSYVMAPASSPETEAEECSNPEINDELFHGLRVALSLMDQGLLCSSTYNIETMALTIFQCFYVLLPSDKGPMLVRRVAASEEILPIPETMLLDDKTVSQKIVDSVQASLSMIKLGDYNPLLHETGLHVKLNMLIKESLQFGAISKKKVDADANSDGTLEWEDSILLQPSNQSYLEIQAGNDKTNNDRTSITKEWEQLLVVENVEGSHLPPYSRSKIANERSSSQNKPMGVETSRILERLEPPKQPKLVRKSPITVSNSASMAAKKPLLPFTTTTLSQPMKPTFQKSKRKGNSKTQL